MNRHFLSIALAAASLTQACTSAPQAAFDEPYRPGYHFSPPENWCNDPNGMVYFAGEYHLFFQYNPKGTRWGNMSWGHAVSADLMRWHSLPVALAPDSLGTIFSGSAVVDERNTAGFAQGDAKALLAFYTNAERRGQIQSMAYSIDSGRTWTKYAHNPVLTKADAPDFRDPKVFWHAPTARWVMVLAVGQVVEFYSSSDGKAWTFESTFGEGHGCHAGVWECPDLFELPVTGGGGTSAWALIVNINPGGPAGGSATQYFVGGFDGHRFSSVYRPDEVHWLDYGKDLYATVTWSDAPDGRRIALGWMSNWEYANDVPTVHFRNAMSLPRELKMAERNGQYVLLNAPVSEVEALRRRTKSYAAQSIAAPWKVEPLLKSNAGMYELLLDIAPGKARTITLTLANDTAEHLTLTLDFAAARLTLDRTQSGISNFSKTFAATMAAPLAALSRKEKMPDKIRLRLLVDRCSVECFVNDGELSLTSLIFPHRPYNTLTVAGDGADCTADLTIHELN